MQKTRMEKKTLAAEYCKKMRDLLTMCSKIERAAHKDDRKKLYNRNDIRITRLLTNYSDKLKNL